MKKLTAMILIAAAAPSAFAGSVGGFVSGGVSSASATIEDDSGSKVDIDAGAGFNISGGLRFHPSMMLRASFDTTNHDSGSGCISGFGCASFTNEDIDINETRFGFFYAPPHEGVVGFLVGAGFEKVELKDNKNRASSKADGGFVEAALLLNAGRVATFTIGGAGFSLENENDEDTSGSEGKVGVTFHAGPVDIGVIARRVALSTDFSTGGSEDDTVNEVQLTIGGNWGYPK